MRFKSAASRILLFAIPAVIIAVIIFATIISKLMGGLSLRSGAGISEVKTSGGSIRAFYKTIPETG